jgi:peroxiredoxin Q/BCP
MSDRVLRKRAAPPPAPERPAKKPAAAKPKKSLVEKVVANVKKGAAKAEAAVTNGASSSGKAPVVGDVIDVKGFGGEVETHEGVKTTLAELVEKSEAGVVLFTYPKASTPGW